MVAHDHCLYFVNYFISQGDHTNDLRIGREHHYRFVVLMLLSSHLRYVLLLNYQARIK